MSKDMFYLVMLTIPFNSEINMYAAMKNIQIFSFFHLTFVSMS